ncbi:RNA-binding protein 25-like [Gigantopelta aegis]|uniref:RNA-binding protein 25-like n=1 Tax=Gigantopelta aegis TaxID=1735272 RepID=UPI001B887988|nr:RNA-binding protein 25-like [Gigantopelta aegis]
MPHQQVHQQEHEETEQGHLERQDGQGEKEEQLERHRHKKEQQERRRQKEEQQERRRQKEPQRERQREKEEQREKQREKQEQRERQRENEEQQERQREKEEQQERQREKEEQKETQKEKEEREWKQTLEEEENMEWDQRQKDEVERQQRQRVKVERQEREKYKKRQEEEYRERQREEQYTKHKRTPQLVPEPKNKVSALYYLQAHGGSKEHPVSVSRSQNLPDNVDYCDDSDSDMIEIVVDTVKSVTDDTSAVGSESIGNGSATQEVQGDDSDALVVEDEAPGGDDHVSGHSDMSDTEVHPIQVEMVELGQPSDGSRTSKSEDLSRIEPRRSTRVGKKPAWMKSDEYVMSHVINDSELRQRLKFIKELASQNVFDQVNGSVLGCILSLVDAPPSK